MQALALHVDFEEVSRMMHRTATPAVQAAGATARELGDG
jgi:hypothetical protein